MKQYEILKYLPPYGDVAIPITHGSDLMISEGYVIKFYRVDGTSWIANFQKGYKEECSFVKSNNNFVIVVAGGHVYLMNPNNIKPLKDFDYDCCEVLQIDNHKFIIFDETDIIILNSYGEVEWTSGCVSYSGFINIKINNNIVNGLLYEIGCKDEPGWKQFSFNIKTKEIDIEQEQINLSIETQQKTTKPWWKFW